MISLNYIEVQYEILTIYFNYNTTNTVADYVRSSRHVRSVTRKPLF